MMEDLAFQNNVDSAVSYCYFFGAYCAAYGIKDSIIVLHTPSGCQRRILYLWSMHDNSNNFKATLSTNLIDKDVVFGTENKLVAFVEDTCTRYDGKVVFILTSCAPEIVGIDYNLVVPQVKNSSKKIIPINSPGFRGDFYEGFIDAILETVKSLPIHKEKYSDRVNIVGYMFSRYEEDENGNIEELKKILDKLDLKVNAVFFSGDTYRDLEKFSQAKYNIIFPYGEKCSKYLQHEVGQENIFCDLPIGLEKTIDFINCIASATQRKETAKIFIKRELSRVIPKVQNTIHKMTGKKVAVVSDWQSIKSLLPMILEFGMEPVLIGIYNSNLNKSKEKILDLIAKNSTLQYEPIVIEACTRGQIKETLKGNYVDFCIGSSIESRDLDELGIPTLEYSLPLFEKHYNFNSPTLGFDGVLNMSTQIFNLLNKKALRRESVIKKLESLKK